MLRIKAACLLDNRWIFLLRAFGELTDGFWRNLLRLFGANLGRAAEKIAKEAGTSRWAHGTQEAIQYSGSLLVIGVVK
jgi:hypothetical protein